MGHMEHCGQCDNADPVHSHDHCGECGGHRHDHSHCGECDGHDHDHCGECGSVTEIGGGCDECGECGEHRQEKEMDPALQEKLLRLSDEVLDLTHNTLLVHLRFLDAALNQLLCVPVDNMNLATDGKYMAFSPGHILWCYRNEPERTARDYLHVLFHCVFRHMYVDTLIDQRCWDLACDIAVEYAITRLELSVTAAQREAFQAPMYPQLLEQAGRLTAERIYRWLLDAQLPEEKMEELQALFYADEHALWYASEQENDQEGDEAPASSSPDDGEEPPDGESAADGSAPREQPEQTTEERWGEIARRMQVDMETFSREKEDKAGALTQNLREANRERYDYTRFLKKFAVPGEIMKINDEEFDYIYYTYGLKLYENMPLVEPLEYKEVRRIREFVVAIDTSGSVSGRLVQLFVQKTYNILKSTESFFSRINLHIIQCDAQIQQDTKITCQEEFDRYLETMDIHGLGGTDFRPVFRYVEKLRQEGEFENLTGLIYFTDGFGTFPRKKPDYETAFVFIDDELHSSDVPPWAIRLELRPEDIL